MSRLLGDKSRMASLAKSKEAIAAAMSAPHELGLYYLNIIENTCIQYIYMYIYFLFND